jgi:hypothetical protein
MRYTSRTATYLAAIFGLTYAVLLQTELGKTLSRRMTWLSVVIGIGVDLLLARPIVQRQAWNTFAVVFTASSIGIIARSLINELRDITAAGVINAGYTGQRRP